MKTVIKDEINKEQVKLNLAINYMVIERVLRCMGIYNTVCDIHEGLDGKDGIFASARDRSLLDKLLNLGKEGVEVYLEEYHELFGLSYAVLLGQKQIRLGIIVDEIELSGNYEGLRNFDADELQDIIKEEGSEIQILDFGDSENDDLYNRYKLMLNNSLDKSIGSIIFDEITDNINILKQLQFNPFGINTFGLFAELLLDNKINLNIEDSQNGTEHSDKLDECFNDSFNNINISTWERKETKKKKESKQGKSVTWKDNIYSLDSIIYSILRYLHQDGEDIIGGELGNKKYQILDIEGEALPYPLKFVGEITYPITFESNNYHELYKESDLLILMCTLMSNEYRVADRKLELITQSSIEKEIKRYKERIKAISTRQDRIDVEIYNAKDTAKITLAEIAYMNKNLYYYNNIGKISEPTVEECKSYVNFLEEQQKLFDTDPKQWAEQYIKVLDSEQKALDGQIQLLDIEIKINKNEEEEKQSPAYYILCNKREILKNRIVLIEKHKKKLNNKANQKNPAPFILVKEPYYEEVGLEDYITRGTKDKTNKKKSKKKNKKKNKKTEK